MPKRFRQRCIALRVQEYLRQDLLVQLLGELLLQPLLNVLNTGLD